METNNLQETMEIIEPTEVIEEFKTIRSGSNKNVVLGAVIVTGIVAGIVGIKKFMDKKKSVNIVDEIQHTETVRDVNKAEEEN